MQLRDQRNCPEEEKFETQQKRKHLENEHSRQQNHLCKGPVVEEIGMTRLGKEGNQQLENGELGGWYWLRLERSPESGPSLGLHPVQ